ncbi:MAG TPA: glutamyl-tRNA reductase [Chthonomonadaceae bacterium]|nr:glutamyl-tRNA reductase [Chthonomonadaceae bacterium]
MHVVLVGLSHHRAPIEVRERLSCSEARITDALASLAALPGVSECAVLSTCNRMEVYSVVEGMEVGEAYAALSQHLSTFHETPQEAFEDYLFRQSDQDAASHLLRVASGLDSLVLGEAQILGQVRGALRAAQDARTGGSILSRLFQQALACGKRVQQETALGRGAFSIGHAAVELASRIFALPDATVLILGAGKMSELTARHLVSNGVRVVFVANRTYERAQTLADRLGGQAIHYDRFPETLVKADIVISSTASPHFVLHRDMVQPVMKKRRGNPLFLIDIAVPRDIDPEVGDLDNVFLYNIDDLQAVVADEAKGRAAEAAKAENLVGEETAKFIAWYRAREAAPVITLLKAQMDQIAQRRLEMLRPKLSSISERDWQTIETHLRSLMNEAVREPILRLKRAQNEAQNGSGSDGAQYDLLAAAREIFGLGASECEEREEETA